MPDGSVSNAGNVTVTRPSGGPLTLALDDVHPPHRAPLILRLSAPDGLLTLDARRPVSFDVADASPLGTFVCAFDTGDVSQAAATLAAALVVMAIQNAMYGSPFKSGYGDLDEMFAAAHVIPNAQRYGRWLIEAQTPAIAAALLSPWLLTGPRGRRYALWLMMFAAITFACYLPYVVFDAWWYTRFLLPATLPLLALTAAVTVTLIARALAPARLIVFGLLTTTLVAVSIRTASLPDASRGLTVRGRRASVSRSPRR